MNRVRNSQAFTLVEVLAAMLFLAITIPAITSALYGSGRTAEAAERSAIAGHLAQNKLDEVIIMEKAAEAGGAAESETSGNFGTDYSGYRWERTEQPWSTDSTLTESTVRVFFQVKGVERSVELTTLVNSNPGSTGTGSGTGGGGQ